MSRCADGVQLACRYAYPTTKLGYCGPQKLSDKVRLCAKDGECDGMRERLLGYEALPIYLKLIAGKHGMDPLDVGVVEAFWLGNGLSFSIGTAEIREAFSPLMKAGYYRERLGPKFDRFPPDCHPTHSFHVLLIGSITGVLGDDLESINNCLVREGVVSKNGVDMECLVRDGDNLTVGRETVQNAKMEFVEPSPGDKLSFHWLCAAQVLDSTRSKNHSQDLSHHLRIRNRLT